MTHTNTKKITASYKTTYDYKNDNKKSNKNIENITITAPCIDKLSVVIQNVTDEQYITASQQAFWDMVKSPELGISSSKKTIGYKTCVKISELNLSNTIQPSSPVHVQVGHYKPERPQIRIDFNPSKMTDAFIDQLDNTFETCLGFSFYQILSKAKVTRIDIAVNVFNTHIEELLVKVRKKRLARSFFNQDGEISMMAFGGSKGNQYTVYSKSEELGAVTTSPALRIEARMRPKGLMMKDIASMPNPLECVQIYDLDCADKSIDTDLWTLFRDSCRYRGVNNALKILSGKNKKHLEKALLNNPADWWIPEIFWGERWIDIMDDHEFLEFPDCPDLTYVNAAGSN